MEIRLEENTTRKNIILLLKKNGSMSIDDLSRVIEITPMGVRQHLLALEKKGLVTYVPKRKGIGRPGFVYMLTDAADILFPNAYDTFALGLLRDIRDHEGQDKVDLVLSWRRERLMRAMRDALAGREGIGDILAAFTELLRADGHLVDLDAVPGHFRINQHHCPIHKISLEFNSVCDRELELYRDIIDSRVTRLYTISEGAASCVYLIPAA